MPNGLEHPGKHIYILTEVIIQQIPKQNLEQHN